MDPNKIKGDQAERYFQKWLEDNEIPYLFIDQDKDTFSSMFKDKLKRPDFMLLVPNFGFIFVDVKDRKISRTYQTYPVDEVDAQKYSSLQRQFNLQTWCVISNEDYDYKTWLWLPFTKVTELGIEKRTSGKSGQKFFPVGVNEFIQISHDDSLDRLFSKIFSKKM